VKAFVATEKSFVTSVNAIGTPDKTSRTTEYAIVTTENAIGATEKVSWTTENAIGATEKSISTAENAIGATEKTISTTENALGVTEKAFSTTETSGAIAQGLVLPGLLRGAEKIVAAMLFSIRKTDPHPPGVGEWEAMTEHGAPEGTPLGKETRVMNSTNRTNQTAADQQLADGLAKNAGILGTFGFGGKQLKPADVAQVLQGRITAAQAATAARAGLSAAAKTAHSELTSTSALIKAVKQALRALFADDIATLATFGLAPTRVPAPKPATKVAAAAKAKATRVARGTKGKKARLAVTGNVTGVTVTPVTESAAPQPAQTAPSAPSAPTGASK
jgi:hypothetical protein